MDKTRKRTCKMCKILLIGRSDKIFCSVQCKSAYHHRLRQVTKGVCYNIDNILHRNRSILLEVMGKNKIQLKIPVYELERRKFNFNYITTYRINKQGKEYRYVYDFSYMTFSDGQILINRRRQT